ncbi:MAG: hypothetical protein CME88_10555 [Hirschia sp.]|nr:hypothetical protein [Hirschia sp.]MBF18807.1 hypothetical protein [Hirschia sp.]
MDIDSPFTMVVLIVAISVGAGVFNNWIKMRQGASVNADQEQELTRLRKDVVTLTERVRVLETLVTDDDHKLRAQIDSLK